MEKWLKKMMKVKKGEREKARAAKVEKTPTAQKRKYENIQVGRILEEIEKMKQNKQIPEDVPEITEKDVREYLALENELAPMLEKMASAWLEIIDNIATKIQIFKDRYFFTGKPDFHKVQRYLPEIEAGMEMDTRRVFEQLLERIYAEIRPQMVRVGLLIDNSGSMDSKIHEVKMSIMLLLGSLRSFRNLFRERMKDIVSGGSGAELDIVCDTEIMMFNNNSSLVMPFAFQDLSFLEAPLENRTMPNVNPMQETVNAIVAFKRINPSGGTYDADSWKQLAAERDTPKMKEYLSKRMLSDVIFQISDGAIQSSVVDAQVVVDLLRDIGSKVAGFAIGDGADSAMISLVERLGPSVIKANTPNEIVDGFGGLLRSFIVENVEKPMEEYLSQLSADFE